MEPLPYFKIQGQPPPVGTDVGEGKPTSAEQEDPQKQDDVVAEMQTAQQSMRMLSGVSCYESYIFSPTPPLFPHLSIAKEDLEAVHADGAPPLEELQQMLDECKETVAEKQSVTEQLPPHEVHSREEFDVENSDYEQIAQRFYQNSEDFRILFEKTLRVWIQQIQPEKMRGIGPMARKVLQATDKVDKVLSSLHEIHTAQAQILEKGHRPRAGSEALSAKEEDIDDLVKECAEEKVYLADIRAELCRTKATAGA